MPEYQKQLTPSFQIYVAGKFKETALPMDIISPKTTHHHRLMTAPLSVVLLPVAAPLHRGGFLPSAEGSGFMPAQSRDRPRSLHDQITSSIFRKPDRRL